MAIDGHDGRFAMVDDRASSVSPRESRIETHDSIHANASVTCT